MKERWRYVRGYKGSYSVSDLGRVRSNERFVKHCHGGMKLIRCRILKPGPVRGGHLTVLLCKDGQSKTHRVHRLVLEAFVSYRPKGMVCCHWDGNPTNNRLDNLRWDSPQENERDKNRHGTSNIGERHGNSKLTVIDVRRIRRLSRNGLVQREIADWFGVSQWTVSMIVSGKAWKGVV